MSIDRWMDKEVVVHIHNGILLSHKRNAFESVLMRYMNLERIIQSEVSQKEKDKYRVLTQYIESRNQWSYLQTAIERVTGRKDRGLQMEETGCVRHFLSLSLKWQEETNYQCCIFSPSLHKFKKRFLLKSCVAMTTPGSTWTFLKPWANPTRFSYGNVCLKLY